MIICVISVLFFCWLTTLTIDAEAFGADREAVRLALKANNIEARPVWIFDYALAASLCGI